MIDSAGIFIGILSEGDEHTMDNSTIPDFGRGTIDQFEKIATGLFKKKEKPEQEAAVFQADSVDLRGALDEPGRKKWTVLVYIDGNNNLYAPMYDAMKSLEGLGSNKDVNIVAELGCNPGDRKPSSIQEMLIEKTSGHKKLETVGRYLVRKDHTESDRITSPKLEDLGKADMGDPKVLSDFLEWGIRKYPAERYAVIFFDHGAGFPGSMSDENTHNMIDTTEMKEVMQKAAEAAGQKIDLVNFDACLMAQVEVAHSLKESARFMVASEETERGSAQPLAKVLKDLQEGSQEQAMSAEDLARLFVYESFKQNAAETFTTTLSAVDLQKIDGVVKSADKLAKAIMEGDVDLDAIRDNIKKSEHYCQDIVIKLYNDYHDLGHFAQLVKNDPRISDSKVKEAAGEIMEAMDQAVIAHAHSGKNYRNSTGLSTYLPTNYGYDPKPKTDSVNFSSTHDYDLIPYAKETHWDELIKHISRDSKWHNFLSSLGLSREGIETLDRNMASIGSKAMTISKLVLGAGQAGATYEAWQGLRHGVPRSFMWLGSELSTKLGALGGGYKVFKGVKGLYDACQDKGPTGISDVLFTKKDKIVNESLNIAEGTALIAVNTALLMGAAAGLTTTAAVLSFALPAAKIIYDVINVPKNLKKKAEEMQAENPVDKMTVEEKLKDMEANDNHLVRP